MNVNDTKTAATKTAASCPIFKIEINRKRPVSEGASWWASREGTPGQDLWFAAMARHAPSLKSEGQGPTLTLDLISAAAFISEAAEIAGWSGDMAKCPFVLTRLEDGEPVRPEPPKGGWFMGYMITPQWILGDHAPTLDVDEVCDDYEAPTDDDGAPAPVGFYAWGPFGIGHALFADPARDSEALRVQRAALDELGLLPLGHRDTVMMAKGMADAEQALAPAPEPSPSPAIRALR